MFQSTDESLETLLLYWFDCSMQSTESLQKIIASRFDPPCLRYWDRKFQAMHLWRHWLDVRARVEGEYRFIQHHLECTHRQAKKMAWMTYIESTGGEQDNPFFQVHTKFVQRISDIELPLFLCHLSIGTDIQNGHSEGDAIHLYKTWLEEDPANPIFGEWALTSELQIVPLQTWLQIQQTKRNTDS